MHGFSAEFAELNARTTVAPTLFPESVKNYPPMPTPTKTISHVTQIKNIEPLGRHFGEVPSDPHVVAEMRRAHRLGHNTILSAEYEAFAESGLGLDQLALALPVASRDAFAPPSLV